MQDIAHFRKLKLVRNQDFGSVSKRNDRENVFDILFIHLLIHLFVSQIFAEHLLTEHQCASPLLGAVNTGILLADVVTAFMELLN